MVIPVARDLIVALNDEGDNPYPTDNGPMRNRLLKYVKEHPNCINFIGDWKDNLHSREIYEPIEDELKKLYSTPIDYNVHLHDIPRLDGIVKGFFRENNGFKFSKELMDWASIGVDEYENQSDDLEIQIDEENVEEEENESVHNQEAYIDILPDFNANTEIIPADEISTYNFASNATITYQELAELCLNQARKSYVSQKARNLELATVEQKRREKLISTINKYFDLNEIAENLSSREQRLEKMTIDELEILRQQCEDKFDMLKTKDMIKNVLAAVEIGYKACFGKHGGIPIGKERILTIDESVIQEINNTLFDVRSVPGNACRRIIDKHHFHLADEVTVGLEVLKILLQGSHIVRKDEMEEADEEEEELEEEEEELEEI